MLPSCRLLPKPLRRWSFADDRAFLIAVDSFHLMLVMRAKSGPDVISSIAKPGRKVLALAIAVACCSLATSAEPELSAPEPAAIQALLRLNGTGNIGTQVGPVAAQQMIVALRRANPNLPARADAVITDVVVTYMRQRAEHDRVIDRLIPIYSKHLTKVDVQQLMEFYRSPVGRKLVSVMPQIFLESLEVGQRWTESILPELQTQLLERLRSENLIE
jgi:uncharacterized protein